MTTNARHLLVTCYCGQVLEFTAPGTYVCQYCREWQFNVEEKMHVHRTELCKGAKEATDAASQS